MTAAAGVERALVLTDELLDPLLDVVDGQHLLEQFDEQPLAVLEGSDCLGGCDGPGFLHTVLKVLNSPCESS